MSNILNDMEKFRNSAINQYWDNYFFETLNKPSKLYELLPKEEFKKEYKVTYVRSLYQKWIDFKAKIKYSIACWLYGEDIDEKIDSIRDEY